MNNLKKALALVMSMALAASTLVAGAASYDDVPATHTNAQAISLLGDLGVMVGDAGTGDFRPDGTLKRSEAAAIVYRLRTGKTNAENFAGAASEMTDIEGHWAAGYIKYCEAESIISGYPDKTFRPDQEVTYAEFTTMLVRALNLQEVKEVSTIVDGVINTEKVVTTTFPNGYIAIADKQGINDKVSLSTNEPADRASVAQMAYNAIFEADYLKTIGERDNIYTLSEEVFKLTKVSDTIVTAVGDVKCVSASAADTDEVTFDSAVGTEKNVESGHSLSGSYEFAVDPALVGQQVDVYYKNKDGKKTIMAVVPADGNIVTTVNAADIDVDGTTIKYVNAEGKTKKLERDFTLGKLMVNGEYVDYTQLSGANMTDIVKLLDANVPMTVTIVDNADGANDVDVLKVDVYATAEISAVESKAIYLTAQAENIMTTANSSYSALYKTLADRAINTATKIELYDDDDERKKEVEIYDGIAAEDKVVIYYGAGDAVKIMKAEKQSGTLSQIDDDVYTIGGKDYKLMEGYEALTSASVGKAIDFRVDPVYGYLYWSDKTAADVSDYYYVASVGVDSGVEGTTYKAVVYNYKGEKIVMEVKNATVAEKLNGTLAEKLNGTFVDTTGGGEEGNEPDGVDDEIVVTQAYHKVLKPAKLTIEKDKITDVVYGDNVADENDTYNDNDNYSSKTKLVDGVGKVVSDTVIFAVELKNGNTEVDSVKAYVGEMPKFKASSISGAADNLQAYVDDGEIKYMSIVGEAAGSATATTDIFGYVLKIATVATASDEQYAKITLATQGGVTEYVTEVDENTNQWKNIDKKDWVKFDLTSEGKIDVDSLTEQTPAKFDLDGSSKPAPKEEKLYTATVEKDSVDSDKNYFTAVDSDSKKFQVVLADDCIVYVINEDGDEARVGSKNDIIASNAGYNRVVTFTVNDDEEATVIYIQSVEVTE